MELVIKITGKARDVFACIKQMAEKAGKLTIGETVRIRKGIE